MSSKISKASFHWDPFSAALMRAEYVTTLGRIPSRFMRIKTSQAFWGTMPFSQAEMAALKEMAVRVNPSFSIPSNKAMAVRQSPDFSQAVIAEEKLSSGSNDSKRQRGTRDVQIESSGQKPKDVCFDKNQERICG